MENGDLFVPMRIGTWKLDLLPAVSSAMDMPSVFSLHRKVCMGVCFMLQLVLHDVARCTIC